MSYSTGDYGWLAPNGTFHDVPWGDHQTWAEKYVKNSEIYETLSMKERISSAGLGDALMTRGWILLHNPRRGLAKITMKEEHRYTKAQMDFLFDYYMERDCKDKAYEIIRQSEP